MPAPAAERRGAGAVAVRAGDREAEAAELERARRVRPDRRGLRRRGARARAVDRVDAELVDAVAHHPAAGEPVPAHGLGHARGHDARRPLGDDGAVGAADDLDDDVGRLRAAEHVRQLGGPLLVEEDLALLRLGVDLAGRDRAGERLDRERGRGRGGPGAVAPGDRDASRERRARDAREEGAAAGLERGGGRVVGAVRVRAEEDDLLDPPQTPAHDPHERARPGAARGAATALARDGLDPRRGTPVGVLHRRGRERARGRGRVGRRPSGLRGGGGRGDGQARGCEPERVASCPAARRHVERRSGLPGRIGARASIWGGSPAIMLRR